MARIAQTASISARRLIRPRYPTRSIITTAAPLTMAPSATKSFETAYLASSNLISPPRPSPPREYYDSSPEECLPDPATIAITTITKWIDDDAAYRAYQASFLAGPRPRVATATAGPKTLEDLASRKVNESLRYDTLSGIEILQKSPQVLQEMVLDRMHYVAFRGLQQIMGKKGSEEVNEEDLVTKAARVDLEVWVIKNELIMRQEPSSISGLLTLDDNLDIAFPDSKVIGNYRELYRRQPPRSNFCMFDEKKRAMLRIHNTTEGYIKTFHESTAGILEGLDWDNVLVAGGIALNTLLRVDGASEDEQPDAWVTADRDSDIDVYIHGLNPAEGNKKIKHIYEVWCKNIDKAAATTGKEAPKKLLIKNLKTMNFLSDYPHRRIQIILKIVASPTEVLLNFDLDPCAIGFNGKEVLMLPRCARALETGYSVFTTDLVEGHHLGDRRETQLPRVYKYADRGFGIRILPQYIRHLGPNDFNYFDGEEDRYRNQKTKFVEPEKPVDPSPAEMENYKLKRGLKLIKLMAYIADDFVHRFWVGPTKRSKYVDEYDEQYTRDDPNGNGGEIFEVSLAHFDGRRQYAGKAAPHGKQGLGGFELFYWHAALWRKELQGLLTIKRDSFISPSYEPVGYAELPAYEWNSNFKAEKYADDIRGYNSRLYHDLVDGVGNRLNHWSNNISSYEGYFTKRTERIACGDDIDKVLERELAIPLIIPQQFEDFANNYVKDILKEKGILDKSDTDFEFLIPVHREGMGKGIIQEPPREAGGALSFWIISPTLCWARIDRRIDEVFEVLWNFFHLFVGDCGNIFKSEGGDAWAGLLDQHLGRRAPRVVAEPETTNTTEKKMFAWPNAREIMLFRKWIRDEPHGVDRDMEGYQGDMGHNLFHDEDDKVTLEDQQTCWDGVDETGTLGDWLAWGGVLEEVQTGEMEVRGEKRKRVSLAGSLAPPEKKVDKDNDDDEGGEGEGGRGGARG